MIRKYTFVFYCLLISMIWMVVSPIEADEPRRSGWDGTCLCFSPDGKLIASGGTNKLVRLRAADTGKVKATLSGHTSEIFHVAFSPDGKTLISAADESVGLWDITSGEERATLFSKGRPIDAMAISPDGRIIASGHFDGTRLWNAGTAELIEVLPFGEGGKCLTFSPDGKTLASYGYGTIELWDLIARKRRLVPAVENKDRPFRSMIAFSPDSKTLAMSERTGIRLWDAATGKKRLTTLKFLEQPDSLTELKSLVFFNDENLILCDLENVYSINIPSGKEHILFGRKDGRGFPLVIAISPDKASIAVMLGDEKIEPSNTSLFVIKLDR